MAAEREVAAKAEASHRHSGDIERAAVSGAAAGGAAAAEAGADTSAGPASSSSSSSSSAAAVASASGSSSRRRDRSESPRRRRRRDSDSDDERRRRRREREPERERDDGDRRDRERSREDERSDRRSDRAAERTDRTDRTDRSDRSDRDAVSVRPTVGAIGGDRRRDGDGKDAGAAGAGADKKKKMVYRGFKQTPEEKLAEIERLIKEREEAKKKEAAAFAQPSVHVKIPLRTVSGQMQSADPRHSGGGGANSGPRVIEVILNDRLGKKVRVKCNSNDTVGDLKKLAAAQLGTRPDKLRIQKWYTIYKDNISLDDYEVHDGMGLELYYQ